MNDNELWINEVIYNEQTEQQDIHFAAGCFGESHETDSPWASC